MRGRCRKERYNTNGWKKARGDVLMLKYVVTGAKQMLEPARLAGISQECDALNNRAIFEIPGNSGGSAW